MVGYDELKDGTIGMTNMGVGGVGKRGDWMGETRE
jgi:hypothetical protein